MTNCYCIGQCRLWTIPIVAERSVGQCACRGRGECVLGKTSHFGKNMCDGPELEQHEMVEELKGGWCCWSIEDGRESGMRRWGKEEGSDHTRPHGASKRERATLIRRRVA